MTSIAEFPSPTSSMIPLDWIVKRLKEKKYFLPRFLNLYMLPGRNLFGAEMWIHHQIWPGIQFWCPYAMRCPEFVWFISQLNRHPLIVICPIRYQRAFEIQISAHDPADFILPTVCYLVDHFAIFVISVVVVGMTWQEFFYLLTVWKNASTREMIHETNLYSWLDLHIYRT